MTGQWNVVLQSIVRGWFPISAALAVGFLVGSALREPGVVQAEVRRSPPRAAMQSGAARSQKTLNEISSTLKRIDARLARFEQVVVPDKKGNAPDR
jgi:hypothetical protein